MTTAGTQREFIGCCWDAQGDESESTSDDGPRLILPNELMLEVIDCLPSETLYEIRGVSKFFYQCAKHRWSRELTFDELTTYYVSDFQACLATRLRDENSAALIKRYEFDHSHMLRETACKVVTQPNLLRNLESLSLDLRYILKMAAPRYRQYFQSLFKDSASHLMEFKLISSPRRLALLEFEIPALPRLNRVHLRLEKTHMEEKYLNIVRKNRIARMEGLLRSLIGGAAFRHLHLDFSASDHVDLSGVIKLIQGVQELRSLTLTGRWFIDNGEWHLGTDGTKSLRALFSKHHASLEYLDISKNAFADEAKIPLIPEESMSLGSPFLNTLKLGGVVKLSDAFFTFLSLCLVQLSTFWINDIIIEEDELARFKSIMNSMAGSLRLQNLAVCIPYKATNLLYSFLDAPSDLEVLHLKLAYSQDSFDEFLMKHRKRLASFASHSTSVAIRADMRDNVVEDPHGIYDVYSVKKRGCQFKDDCSKCKMPPGRWRHRSFEAFATL